MKYSNNSRTGAVLALTLAMMTGATDAGAVEPVDRFFVSVGGYKTDNDIRLRWDPSSGEIPGTHVSVKRDLGMKLDATEPFFQIGGTFGHRHRLKAFHYGYDSSGSRTLDRDLVIGDDIYRATAAFAGDIDVSLLGMSYSWLFHHSETSAFGAGLGAIRYKISADLAAALEQEGEIETVSGSISESHWAPLLHMEYVHALAEHWRLGVDASYVRKNGGRVSGSATDIGAKVEFFPWRHFGFALRYNYNDIDLKFDNGDYRGEIDIKNRGPQLVATYRF